MSHWSAHPVRAGGVAILLNPYKIDHSTPALQHLWGPHFIAITAEVEGIPVLVLNVYAPSDRGRREDFFKRLADEPRTHTGPVVLGGDFNCTLHPALDRSLGHTAAGHNSPELSRWLHSWNLHDTATTLHPVNDDDEESIRLFRATQHTFRYKVSGATESSRLDRWYVSAGIQDWIQDVRATDLGGGSDHAGVTLALANPATSRQMKSRPRVYPPKAGAVDAVASLITQALEELQALFDRLDEVGAPAGQYIEAWEAFKSNLVREIARTAKEAIALINRSYKFKIARLRRHIRSPETVQADVEAMEKQLSIIVAMWHDLKLRKRLAKTLEPRASAATVDYGRAAVPRAAQVVVALDSTPGSPPRAETDLSNRMLDGWRDTFTQPARARRPDDYAALTLPCLTPTDAACLAAPFSISEVHASLKRCKMTKSGGPDLLPNSFYRDFSDQLAPILLRLMNKCYTSGTTPASFQTATIVCIPKAGRSTDPLGYRPISLLNTDYKVYMRLLTTRLKPLLTHLIAASQGGFVPGRSIHDIIDLYNGAQARAIETNAETAAVLLDVKKAYDSLDRQYLLETLKDRDFPEAFRQAIDATHTDTTARFCVNGVHSDRLSMTRGIRQGCPLAPMLFIIALDPLYRIISTDPLLAEPIPEAPGLLPPCAGYADDTALYVSDESKLARVCFHLQNFATISGLHVNMQKSVVFKLNPAAAGIGDLHGFATLNLGAMCRYLGAQVGPRISQAAVWQLTADQIVRTLAMARLKNHSIYQRARLATTVALPKILYVARHHWPDSATVARLDACLRNFVWTGSFAEKIAPGAGAQRWMTKPLADLATGAGGLSCPNVDLELMTMAALVVSQWCYDPSGLRNSAAVLLSHNGTQVQPALYLTDAPRRLRRNTSLWATGRQVMGWVYGSTIAYPLQLMIRDGISALQEDTNGSWHREQYTRDYGEFHRVGGEEILRRRTEADGDCSVTWIPHITIAPTGSPILHRDGSTLNSSHLKSLGDGSCVDDYVSWTWAGGRSLQFRPRLYPLSNAQFLCFRLLCDTLVANFPAMTGPPDMPDRVRAYNIPRRVDMEWTLAHGKIRRFDNGDEVEAHDVRTQWDLQHLPRIPVDGTDIVPSFECGPLLTRLVRPWRGHQAWVPKRRHLKRALGRGLRADGAQARDTREQRWKDTDNAVAEALASVNWSDYVRQEGLTTYETQLWTRLRLHQLRVWGTGDNAGTCRRHSCSGTQRAAPEHIAWQCPAADELWNALARLWGARAASTADVREAVFSRTPLATEYDWRATLPGRASTVSDRLKYWLHLAWVQLVTCGLHRLWTRTVKTAREEVDDRSGEDYHAVVHHWANRLRGNLLATTTRAEDTKEIDLKILRGLLQLALRAAAPERWQATDTAYVLFFDGGSRGNPGPGGSGSVIVRVGEQPEIVWAAAMAYGQHSTTNNQAEYHGLCHGLTAAERHGWTPLEVVGDSMMIIRQMTTRHRPKAPPLQPLYEKARSTADAIRVSQWHHHYRAHNKMADKAANQAMDSGASYQALASSGRQELAELQQWLLSDVTHWSTTHRPPG